MYAGGAGPWGSLQPHTGSALQAWRLALGGSLASPVLPGLWFWAFPCPGRGSWILGRAHGGSNECSAPGAEDLVGTRGLSPPADRGCDVMGEWGQGQGFQAGRWGSWRAELSWGDEGWRAACDLAPSEPGDTTLGGGLARSVPPFQMVSALETPVLGTAGRASFTCWNCHQTGSWGGSRRDWEWSAANSGLGGAGAGPSLRTSEALMAFKGQKYPTGRGRGNGRPWCRCGALVSVCLSGRMHSTFSPCGSPLGVGFLGA